MKPDTTNPAAPLADASESAPSLSALNRRDDHFYEELSRINNELANLQRELARANADLVASQKKLAISEQRYLRLTECSPIAIFELDASGRCLYTNAHWQTISGLTADESLGDGWQRALDPRDAPDFLKERDLARQAGGEFIREVRFVNTRGEQRWAQVHSRPIPAENGEAAGRVSTVEDITERKRTEEALQASERRLKLALQAGGLGAFEHHLRDDRILVSPEFCQVVDWPLQTSISHNDWVELMHPDDRSRVLARVQQMKDEQTVLDLEYRLCLPNGNVRWIRAMAIPSVEQGKVGHIHGVVQDITERKQAEFELRKLSRAVEQSPVAIIITDLQGAIEYVNPKFCAVTGYSFDEVRGKNPRMLKSGAMPAESYRQMWANITAGEKWSGEFHNRKKNGDLYWESASISPISDDHGKVTHFIAVKEDVTGRKQAEEAVKHAQKELAQSERRQKTILDNIPDSVWLRDKEGRYLAVNKAWREFFGLDETQAIGKTEQEIFPPEVARRFREHDLRIMSSCKPLRLEEKLPIGAGGVVWFEIFLAPLADEHGRFCGGAGIARDISLHKQAEDALKEQVALRERLAKLAANVPGIIYSFRLRPDGSACFPYASPTIEEFCGARAEDLVDDDTHFFDLIHVDDQARMKESIADSARTLVPWHSEFRLQHPKKGFFWAEGRSTPEREVDGGTLWHGFMGDVTERKLAEQNLRESEVKLSKMFQSSPVAISLSTVREGRLLDVNEEYLRMVERTREEVLGRTTHEIGLWMVPAQRTGILNQLNRQPSLRNIELDLRAKSGRVNHILWSGEVLVIHGERCLLGSALDITERKRAQAEREKLERRVAESRANEESARLALEHEQRSSQIKSRFVSMVSHEFRTPLSIINMAAGLLDGYRDKMTDAERSEQLTNIRGSVERMTQMMNDFLIHGNCANGKMECKPARVKVEALCRRLIAEVPGDAGSPPLIECAVEPIVGEAWLDEKILRHILSNLLSNAVKYSLDGQPVKLEVRRVAGISRPNGGTDTGGEPHLEFKVSDSGIGIPAADLAKLYQTFHRAANVGNRPGPGMGLAIVKQFVDLLGGRIRFESQEGKGTTVWVQLPVASPMSPAER
jgi:PAS domain S-box-containing protein